MFDIDSLIVQYELYYDKKKKEEVKKLLLSLLQLKKGVK